MIPAMFDAPARLVLGDGTEFAVMITSVHVETAGMLDVTTATDTDVMLAPGPSRLAFTAVAIGTGRRVEVAPLPASVERAVRAISLGGRV